MPDMQRADRESPPAPATAPIDQAFAAMLLAGLTNAQISRLADLRVLAQRGAFPEDGLGAALENSLAARRHAFARWLVQTGRLREDR